jgi:hypothetical protein
LIVREVPSLVSQGTQLNILSEEDTKLSRKEPLPRNWRTGPAASSPGSAKQNLTSSGRDAAGKKERERERKRKKPQEEVT